MFPYCLYSCIISLSKIWFQDDDCFPKDSILSYPWIIFPLEHKQIILDSPSSYLSPLWNNLLKFGLIIFRKHSLLTRTPHESRVRLRTLSEKRLAPGLVLARSAEVIQIEVKIDQYIPRIQWVNSWYLIYWLSLTWNTPCIKSCISSMVQLRISDAIFFICSLSRESDLPNCWLAR